MNVLSRAELYGGKFCAALDRQHPRDLFDVRQFYMSHVFGGDFKTGFLSLALCHNRPLHELLNPILQDHREIFEKQFAGMTDTEFSYDDHVATFNRLRADVVGSFTCDDVRHMLDFVSLRGSVDDFGIPNLKDLPALAWKRHNLESLRKSDPAKFELQRVLLAKIFEQR